MSRSIQPTLNILMVMHKGILRPGPLWGAADGAGQLSWRLVPNRAGARAVCRISADRPVDGIGGR